MNKPYSILPCNNVTDYRDDCRSRALAGNTPMCEIREEIKAPEHSAAVVVFRALWQIHGSQPEAIEHGRTTRMNLQFTPARFKRERWTWKFSPAMMSGIGNRFNSPDGVQFRAFARTFARSNPHVSNQKSRTPRRWLPARGRSNLTEAIRYPLPVNAPCFLWTYPTCRKGNKAEGLRGRHYRRGARAKLIKSRRHGIISSGHPPRGGVISVPVLKETRDRIFYLFISRSGTCPLRRVRHYT